MMSIDEYEVKTNNQTLYILTTWPTKIATIYIT